VTPHASPVIIIAAGHDFGRNFIEIDCGCIRRTQAHADAVRIASSVANLSRFDAGTPVYFMLKSFSIDESDLRQALADICKARRYRFLSGDEATTAVRLRLPRHDA
jgi:hypothetical protein